MKLLVLAVPILVFVAAAVAYQLGKDAGARTNKATRTTAQLNDRAAGILGSLVAAPTDLDDVTVLSTTHRRQVIAWLKEHRKRSR